MKEFTKKMRAKGWLSKDLAQRWGITPNRLSQIANNPPKVYLDALDGLPGRDDDPYCFDDFEVLFAAGNPSEVAALLIAAASKYGWPNEKTLDMADGVIFLTRLAEASRRRGKKN